MFSELELSEYLCKDFACSCGRNHCTNLKLVDISVGAIENVSNHLENAGFSNILVVCDGITYKIAGVVIEKSLKANNINCKVNILEYTTKELIPNEAAVGSVLISVEKDTDCILAVGAGTINDICRFVSFKLDIPYIIFGTAPSMDGYASNVAPLIVNNLKITYDAHVPYGIIGDANILVNAPTSMIQAGYGDIIGKLIALSDWKLSSIVNNEYYCPDIAEIVNESLNQTINSIEGVKNKNPESVIAMMNALVLSGISMSLVNNSRPASGCEHHLSHYWEMKLHMDGKQPFPHGTKVGVGTIVAAKLYECFMKANIDWNRANKKAEYFPREDWKKLIETTYRGASNGVFELEEIVKQNSIEKHKKRLSATKANLEKIHEMIISQVPNPQRAVELINLAGGLTTPQDLGVDKEMLKASILVAKELRDRYTLLQLLWDLDLLEDFAENVAVQYFG